MIREYREKKATHFGLVFGLTYDVLHRPDHPKRQNYQKESPVLSNQKMNTYLKEIADLCGITKGLTFHLARHTFATTVALSNGRPMVTVSRMLGHKTMR